MLKIKIGNDITYKIGKNLYFKTREEVDQYLNNQKQLLIDYFFPNGLNQFEVNTYINLLKRSKNRLKDYRSTKYYIDDFKDEKVFIESNTKEEYNVLTLWKKDLIHELYIEVYLNSFSFFIKEIETND